jgi:small GTP-binding protein
LEYERLLEKRSVVGVGGQFSAGKSCFLNSIIGKDGGGEDYLPEKTTPSTAIATYIVNGENPALFAYTYQGRKLSLNMGVLRSFTHEMIEALHINPSAVVLSLGLEVPSLNLKNIALLDTPGYSKPETGDIDISDRLKALDLLKGVDFLIWLVDADNGELTSSDIRLIESLNVKDKILFVVNKADKKEDIGSIVNHIRDTIETKSLPAADVVPYSSQNPENYPGGRESIWRFLNNCDDEGRCVKGLSERIDNKLGDITVNMSARQKEAAEMKEEIKNVILENAAPGRMFLPYYYFEADRRVKSVQRDKNEIIKIMRMFEKQFMNAGGTDNG